MNFTEFQAWKAAHAHEIALDLSETAITRCVAAPDEGDPGARLPGYRCHLAEEWAAWLGLPELGKARVLISEGVRHSLQLLFAGWAARQRRLLLPADVYPVYRQLADTAGLASADYPTLPALPEHLPDADVLLLTLPLKPRGTYLTLAELATVHAWLAGSSDRRVVVDAVYHWGGPLHAQLLGLFATGQAWLLHSFSKAWARPRLAGCAIGPATDVAEWQSVFRNAPFSRDPIALARTWLRDLPDFGLALAASFAQREAALQPRLAEAGASLLCPAATAPGYLRIVDRPWRQLWDERRWLCLPASVFGSDCTDRSIASLLMAGS